MSEIKCTVCGSDAKHILKGGAVELCQKHFDQKFGKYSRGAEEGSAPVQDPMELGEMANWTPLDGTPGLKRKRSESGVFSAPMGYAPDGPKPFYGNRRKLIRDQWGNLRFIRRRKNGTYMDNVDFGRSIRADKQRQAKTWAPSGFRDQGDGSPNLLMRLMGAEGDDRDARYQFVVDIYDNDGNECYGAGGYFGGFGSTIQQAADDARKAIIEDMEQEQRRINKAQSRNKAPRAQATRSVAGARFVTVMEFDDDELDYVEIDADLPADIKFNTALAAEGKGREKETKLWVVAAMADELIWSEENQFDTTVRVFDNHINAKKYFNELLLMNGYTGEELNSPEDHWEYSAAAIPQPMDDGEDLFIEIAIKELSMGYDNGEVYSAETSPDYNASAYDPLSESATPSGYDPVTFEAPKGKKTKAKREMTYKQSHNALVSTTIRALMHDYDRTGKVGNSSPKNRGAALKQAIAIAYSKTNQTYKRSGKRLPSGVKRAEGEDSDYDALAYNPLGESATPSGYDPVTFGAESGDSVWLVNSALDGNWEEALLFRDKSDARASFEEYIDQLGGKVADASYGDWSGDDGFRRVVMYQVTIQ